ncbi:DUF1189 domain-containing protein [Enterococcus sp. JM9B]|uniref:DUF1189 domain-containing protein n=1 Tax=Enterococcus sp. JM9B TaxID=1857216 RepID=UPI0013750369|nr:DUF1189 domain-containing protein [Enterococcus sp. JM9B]KAF1304810.1 hypothetical protein BAU16_01160 [Enterococcus sp. JM9B]
MTVLQLFKSSFFRFKDLAEARKISFIKIIGYLVLLSAFLAIPITFQVSRIIDDVQKDGQAIAEKIPDFTIQNGTLTPEKTAEGFIYQTNSIIFTFDPEGKRSANDISTDMIGNFLSIGLLKNNLVIALPSSGFTTQFLGDNQLVLSYKEDALQSLDGSRIRTFLQQNQIPWWIQLVTFFVALYPTFLDLILTVLMITVGATIYSKLRRLPLKFFDNLKIAIFSATLPAIIVALFSIFITFDSSTFLLIASLFIYMQAVKAVSPITN